MSKRKVMTRAAHIKAGENLRMVKCRLLKAEIMVYNGTPKNSAPATKLRQARRAIDDACNLLDEDWCRDCVPPTPEGDEVFADHEFPYYGPVEECK